MVMLADLDMYMCMAVAGYYIEGTVEDATKRQRGHRAAIKVSAMSINSSKIPIYKLKYTPASIQYSLNASHKDQPSIRQPLTDTH